MQATSGSKWHLFVGQWRPACRSQNAKCATMLSASWVGVRASCALGQASTYSAEKRLRRHFASLNTRPFNLSAASSPGAFSFCPLPHRPSCCVTIA